MEQKTNLMRRRLSALMLALILMGGLVIGCVRTPQTPEVTPYQIERLRKTIKGGSALDGSDDALLGRSSGYEISTPFDWTCKAYLSNPTFCFRMHGFTFLDDEYALWVQTGQEQYKKLIIEWVNDWIRSNPEIDMTNEWAWNDDSVARRVFRLSVYAQQWEDDFSKSELVAIKKSLETQAELLASDDFYTEKHNHGMFQDMGLIAYALLHGSDRERDEYLALARERSNEYFQYSFTKEGVHKEHSPDYHMWVATVGLAFYRDIYREIDQSFSDDMSELLDNTAAFYTQLVMPDGTVPSIGDSARKESSLGVYNTPEYLWASTKGAEGVPAEDTAIFAESGYAVMRSSWRDPTELATYLLFMAATHSSAHKHGDDLSFILYHGGDLFTEAGNRDHRYTSEMTAYTYSGYAHNVLTVDGNAFPVDIGASGFQAVLPPALNTRILDYDIDGESQWVQAQQERFDDVTQRRTVAYNKTMSYVTVVDSMKATGAKEATLIYHIAPDIRVVEEGKGWSLYRSEDLVARVTVKSDALVSLDTITGTGRRPYYSVLFEGQKTPKEASLLKVNLGLQEGVNEVEMSVQLMPL